SDTQRQAIEWAFEIERSSPRRILSSPARTGPPWSPPCGYQFNLSLPDSAQLAAFEAWLQECRVTTGIPSPKRGRGGARVKGPPWHYCDLMDAPSRGLDDSARSERSRAFSLAREHIPKLDPLRPFFAYLPDYERKL